jgi:hypothetical protein
MRLELHGAPENPHKPNACPASEKFPAFPKIRCLTPADYDRKDKLFDARLKRHWTKRGTAFEALS